MHVCLPQNGEHNPSLHSESDFLCCCHAWPPTVERGSGLVVSGMWTTHAYCSMDIKNNPGVQDAPSSADESEWIFRPLEPRTKYARLRCSKERDGPYWSYLGYTCSVYQSVMRAAFFVLDLECFHTGKGKSGVVQLTIPAGLSRIHFLQTSKVPPTLW